MEPLLRWREPAVVVVLAVLAIRLGLALAFAVRALVQPGGAADLAAYAAAGSAGEPVLILLLAVLVVCCHAAPATPHVRTLTVLGLVGAVAAVVVVLVLGVVWLTVRDGSPLPTPLAQLDVAERLLALVVPVLVVLALAVLVRRPVVDADAARAQPALPAPEVPAIAAAAPDPERQPTSEPDVATGAAWLSAGDAASGRPATGWGTATGSGWDAPPQPAATDPVPPPTENPHPWAAGPH